MPTQPTVEEKLMIYEGKFVSLQLRDGKQLKGTIRRKVDGNWEIVGSHLTAPHTARGASDQLRGRRCRSVCARRLLTTQWVRRWLDSPRAICALLVNPQQMLPRAEFTLNPKSAITLSLDCLIAFSSSLIESGNA
jgi:hypothetical protein